MPEAMLLGVAKSVLGQLSSPALKEALLLWNFDKDLKRLRETIQTINCVIHDAERRQSEERLVKLWLSRLSVVLYEADDLVDTIAARALRKKSVGGSTVKKEELLWLHDTPWDLLPSLSMLLINSTMHSIPPGIQQLATLRFLQLWDCPGIKEIPEWMVNMTSLQELHIKRCSPEFKARCEPETGTDWHLVSHIPSIEIETT